MGRAGRGEEPGEVGKSPLWVPSRKLVMFWFPGWRPVGGAGRRAPGVVGWGEWMEGTCGRTGVPVCSAPLLTALLGGRGWRGSQSRGSEASGSLGCALRGSLWVGDPGTDRRWGGRGSWWSQSAGQEPVSVRGVTSPSCTAPDPPGPPSCTSHPHPHPISTCGDQEGGLGGPAPQTVGLGAAGPSG